MEVNIAMNKQRRDGWPFAQTALTEMTKGSGKASQTNAGTSPTLPHFSMKNMLHMKANEYSRGTMAQHTSLQEDAASWFQGTATFDQPELLDSV